MSDRPGDGIVHLVTAGSHRKLIAGGRHLRAVGLVGEAPSARLDEAESTWIIASVMRADNGPAC